MRTIRTLFEKPIDRSIEEVIKVDQRDEKVVAMEIDEYVVTDSIRDHFGRVYKGIAEGPANPREGNAIWVSGFFGSGKSLFAKILGYTVADRKVGGTTASALFKGRLRDERVAALLDSINTRIPFDAVIFDVSMERGVRFASERLTEILYRALLRHLGYCEDFDLAELERTLEADGLLEEFERCFERLHGKPWSERRQLGLAINEASAALHELDPRTYPATDTYAVTTGKRGRADIDPNRLAQRAYELAARRAPGKALIFVIDEVGQFVSRSVDKMIDLQAIVQAMGVEGRNRTEKKLAVSPFWIVVTSQEKLSEVVTALDSKKIELSRLQDRFPVTVDLKQTDVAEVTARRVLGKNAQAMDILGKLYDANAGRIRECCTLERSSRNLEISRGEFIRLYPYVPYQLELCIDIVSSLRSKRGVHRHVGGSNRTLIKQAQQMMINDRTRLADAPVGALVTLDKVYELLEVGMLIPSETSREIANVASRLSHRPLATSVVKAIALLESVKDLPRTAHNIAVVLHPAVDAPPLRKEVEAALAELEKAQFIRNTEEGYKLLTAQEKNWEERRNALDPREADRNRLLREVVRDIFSDPQVRTHRYRNLRTFKLGITLDGEGVETDGDVMLHIRLADPGDDMRAAREEARKESASNLQEVFWVAPFTGAVNTAVVELYRSREIIAEYERLAAQQKLTGEEGALYADEKGRRDRHQRELRKAVQEAVEAGRCFFQGVEREAKAMGESLQDMMRGLIDVAVAELYPKLEIGALPLAGGEADKFLTSANLNGLPKVFYHDKPNLSLVIKQAGQFVPNLGCDLCRELLEYLNNQHKFGNKVTGKMLETHFGGIGFGWELESIRLGVAVLFRGGAVEVSHQGRKYRQYTEPTARQPFQNIPAFRAASYAPRETLDLKVLVAAARAYEDITGKEVHPEEGAIAQAFKSAVEADREKLLPLSSRFQALHLPGTEKIREHLGWLEGILESAPDDCVKTLAYEGKSFLENRRAVMELEKAATEANIEAYFRARRVLEEQWPLLRERGINGELGAAAEELAKLLQYDECLTRMEPLRSLAERIDGAYRREYAAAFEKRQKAYAGALETIKGRPEWLAACESSDITEEEREAVLKPLSSKAEVEMDLPAGATVCRRTRATLAQLESEAQAVEAVSVQVLRRLQELVAPREAIERVSVAKFYPAKIASEEELERFIIDLQEALRKILARGASIILE